MSDIDFDVLEERGYRYVSNAYRNWVRRRNMLKENYNKLVIDSKTHIQAHKLIHRLMMRMIAMEKRQPPLIG